jgi:GT2 family glycosyltransferase
MSAPSVSVVIVTYESGPMLQRCLDALKAQRFTDFETILSDNGSADRAAQAAAAADPSLILLENGANLGFAAGNNRAALKARGRWLALLNPDAFPEPDWLERLVAKAEGGDAVTAWTSLQIADDDGRLLDGAGDAMTIMGLPYRMGYRRARPAALEDGEVFSPCGAAMLIDRQTYLALGRLDERFFCYCEDADLGWRLRLAGGRTRLAADAVVRHVGSATSGARSDFTVYHGARNRLWCWAKNAPPVLFALGTPMHLLAGGLFSLLAGKAGRRGFRDGLKRFREFRRERPAGGSADIARAMTWNPWKAATRGLDVRRDPEPRPSAIR